MVHSPAKMGILMILLSNVAFTGMVILLRLAAVENSAVSAMARFAIGVVVVSLLAFSGKIHLKFNDRPGLILRGILGGTAIGLGFLGIHHLGVIQGTILMNTYPIFAVLFSMISLEERPGIRKLLAIGIAFFGIVLTIGGRTADLFTCTIDRFTLLALLGGALGGAAVVQVKKISRTEISEVIFLAQCLGGIGLMIIPAASAPVELSSQTMILLLLMGISATLGQLLFTHGVRSVSVSTTSLLSLTGPIMSVLAGIVIFREPMTPLMAVGVAITLGSLTILAYQPAKSAAKQ